MQFHYKIATQEIHHPEHHKQSGPELRGTKVAGITYLFSQLMMFELELKHVKGNSPLHLFLWEEWTNHNVVWEIGVYLGALSQNVLYVEVWFLRRSKIHNLCLLVPTTKIEKFLCLWKYFLYKPWLFWILSNMSTAK